MPKNFTISVGDDGNVTGLLYAASTAASATLILGHGAGAGQTSRFMVDFAQGIADRGIDAATFNFLYTEKHRGAPDHTEKLEACWRAAIATTREIQGSRASSLFIGGKSMGGRIASHVAASGVDDLAGLVFLGYPLHPPGRPEQLRSKHLARIKEPMLFVQGSRDSFGTPAELQPIIDESHLRAVLHIVDGGDHSFKVPKRGSPPQDQVYKDVLDEIARWIVSNLRD